MVGAPASTHSSAWVALGPGAQVCAGRAGGILTYSAFCLAAEEVVPGAEREGSRGQHPGDADGPQGAVAAPLGAVGWSPLPDPLPHFNKTVLWHTACVSVAALPACV